MTRVDYSGEASAYRRARTLPADVLAEWRAAIHDLHLPQPRLVIDLGAGPGGFLGPLTDWFRAPVVAIEPSAAMRAEAAATGLTEAHPYLAAAAEALPMRDGSADLAWLSTVIHQFDDRDQVARELRRVIRPGGHVLVRGFLADVPITGLFAQFPGIDRSGASFPSTAEIVGPFAAQGFATERIVDVVEPWRFDPTDWVERVRSVRHTDSALRVLDDDEFELGVRRVVERNRGSDVPLVSDGTLRLVVLRALPAEWAEPLR